MEEDAAQSITDQSSQRCTLDSDQRCATSEIKLLTCRCNLHLAPETPAPTTSDFLTICEWLTELEGRYKDLYGTDLDFNFGGKPRIKVGYPQRMLRSYARPTGCCMRMHIIPACSHQGMAVDSPTQRLV